MDQKNPEHSRFSIEYRITLQDSRSIEEVTRDICVEQTVEIPYEFIPRGHFTAGLIGRVENVRALDDQNRWSVSISYRSDCTAFSIPQLLNVLYGNISLKTGIRITGLELDTALQNAFAGPQYGCTGIRSELGLYGRPLACTALKPMGLSSKELAELAGKFASGGIDLIKDDHGITDQQFHPFEERVARCQDAVESAYLRTGKKTLYFPMVAGRYDQIEKQVQFAVKQGVRGILIAPMLVGLDTMRYLGETYSIMIMAHPALTGSFFSNRDDGIDPEVMLGTIFRLAGSDISIFPNWGGRFPLSRENCLGIADALRRRQYDWKPAFPCPAGGMNLNRIEEMGKAFGEETVLLIGGALLDPSKNVTDTTTEFMDTLRHLFAERREIPAGFVSSCSWNTSVQKDCVQSILTCNKYRWSGRTMVDYKQDSSIPFKNIARSELIGSFGESTSFDLRYFEIEPGGYSSFEKHIHEHVIIGVRGEGKLVKADCLLSIKEHDVAYVAPLEPHQLKNDGPVPFGFFCIVDHVRDKPQQV